MNYKSFQAKGELQSGKLTIQELVLDASAMQLASQGEIDLVNQRMDLLVAVSPLKTVNWMVRHIRLLDDILEGNLITIPVRVRGDLKDPKIIPLAPSEVGDRLVGIMKRTLKLPFKIVQPVVKDLEKPQPQPEANR